MPTPQSDVDESEYLLFENRVHIKNIFIVSEKTNWY